MACTRTKVWNNVLFWSQMLPSRRLSLRRGLRQTTYKEAPSEDEAEESGEEEEGSGEEASSDQVVMHLLSHDAILHVLFQLPSVC